MPSASNIRAGRAFVEMSLDDTRLERGLRRSSRRMRSWGASMTKAGKQIVGLTSAIAAPIALSTKIFSGFDDAMRTVKSVTGATDQEFAKLTDTAKLLGRTTSFTASQVAELMTELGRAGFDPSQIDAMTGSVLALARATGTDAAQAAGIASATLRQFSIEAEQAGRVADVLTAGANKSFNTLESLGEALKFAGPVAADANMSLEDTVAILGALGNVGIQGSNAGSALRRLLVLSASEAEKFGKVFGVATKTAAGDARPLIDILSDIDTATAGLGSADRAAKFSQAFGLLGITSASALSKSTDAVFNLREQLDGVQGLAEKTAEEMDAGIGGASRRLLSALEGIAIAIGEAAAGPLSEFADQASKLAGYITKIVRNNREFVVSLVKILAIAAAVGVGLIAVGGAAILLGAAISGIAAIVGLVIGAVKVAIAVLAAILSPIGLVVGAILLIGGAILYATGVGGQAIQWLGERFAELKAGVVRVIGGIVDALRAGDVQLAARILWLVLRLAWQQGSGALQGYWAEFQRWFVGLAADAFFGALVVLNNAIAGIQSAWTSLIAWFSSAWNSIKNDAVETWNLIVLQAKKAGNAVRGAFDLDFDTQAANRSAEDQFVQDQLDSQRERREREQQIDRSKDQRQRRIERDRLLTEKVIVDQAERAEASRKADLGSRKDQIAAELKRAENELRDSIAEADRKRRESEAAEASSPLDGPPTPAEFEQQIKRASVASQNNIAAAVVAPLKSAGTFDARAASDLGGRALSEGEQRMIERQDKANEHLKRIERAQRRRQGVAT